MNWKNKISKLPYIGKIVSVGTIKYRIENIQCNGDLDVRCLGSECLYKSNKPGLFAEFKD